MRRRCILGTRGSALALRQASIVQERLKALHPDFEVAVKVITARADAQPDVPLTSLAGEGVFVKELEAALVSGEIDFAVHSLKDLPLAIAPGLGIAAVLKRDEPRDALVCRKAASLDRLPARARVGTSSLRRKSQLFHRRGDLQAVDIRGNVDTRLRKLDEGLYDAVILAACGLSRLGLDGRISELLDTAWMLPEPGQGALAIEIRQDDEAVSAQLSALNDAPTRACVAAERAFLGGLGGGCHLPIAALATEKTGKLFLQGAVIAPDGHEQVRAAIEGPLAAPEKLGRQLADQLSAQGAKHLLVNI